MYETICSVGERGQITLPKEIRVKEKISKKDKLSVRFENGEILIKKISSQKENEALIKEYYEKYSKRDLLINNEFEKATKKENEWLDENFPW